jgi:UPF0391 membrane protein BP1737
LIQYKTVTSHNKRKALPRPFAHQTVCTPNRKEKTMLHYAVVFFVIAIIAAVLGFGGIAGSAAGIAKILFVGFLILSVLSLIFGKKK